jgi:hypothetical protein
VRENVVNVGCPEVVVASSTLGRMICSSSITSAMVGRRVGAASQRCCSSSHTLSDDGSACSEGISSGGRRPSAMPRITSAMEFPSPWSWPADSTIHIVSPKPNTSAALGCANMPQALCTAPYGRESFVPQRLQNIHSRWVPLRTVGDVMMIDLREDVWATSDAADLRTPLRRKY